MVHTPTRKRGLAATATAAIALGATAALIAPSAASAESYTPVVSWAEGHLLEASLGGQSLDSLLHLAGAIAVNEAGEDSVHNDTPLSAELLSGINLHLPAGIPLVGENGIVKLGAVGQYAVAHPDGSSSAFSGTVSEGPSLIGLGSEPTGGQVGAPNAGDSASINVGTSQLLGGADLVNLSIGIGKIAASAHQAPGDAEPVGDYVIADLDIAVRGTLIEGTLGTVNSALNPLLTSLGLTSPIDPSGAIVLSLDDLLAEAGVGDINDLAPGTDLLQYVPAAVVAKVKALVNDLVNLVTSEISGLTQADLSGLNLAGLGLGDLLGGLLGPTLSTVTNALNSTLNTVLTTVVNPLLDGLGTTLGGPLGQAITALVQLKVNNQYTTVVGNDLAAAARLNAAATPDERFTQNALTLGLGDAGSLGSVELANASVGPNAGIEGVPVANLEALLIVGTLAVLGGGGFLLYRRRAAFAPAAA